MLEYSPRNPFRPVHWRWGRAGAVAAGHALSRSRDDAWVHRAAKFRAAADACKSPADFYLLEAKDPPLYWAHELFRHRADEHQERRILVHALEARLLAVQPYDEIARRANLEADVVDAYERVFFNVAGKHDQLDYIAMAVMGPAAYRGIRTRQYDLLWKLYGWGYGPMMVDMFLTMLPARSRPSDEAGLMAAVEDSARASMKLKGMLAAQTVGINDMNAPMLFAEFVKLCEAEKKGGKEAAGQQGLLGNIDGMMRALPFRVGAHAPPEAVAGRKMAVRQLPAYDSGAAELRGDELMLLATGQPIPTTQHLNLLAFPPPPSRAGPAADAAPAPPA